MPYAKDYKDFCASFCSQIIKTENFLKSFLDLFSPGDRVAVLIIPDPDAIASAMAAQFLCIARGISCDIIFLSETKRLDNKKMIEVLNTDYILFSQADLSLYDKFIMTDGQPSHNAISENIHFSAVIDHHPVKGNIEADFTDIRPDYSANSVIMAEYLMALGERIPINIITALYYGIVTDTDRYRRLKISRHAYVIGYLTEYADLEALRVIESEEIPYPTLKIFAKALETCSLFDETAIVFLNDEEIEFAVTIADFLLRVAGVTISIVAALKDGLLKITMRSVRKWIDIGILAETVGFGRGGGHAYAARVDIPVKDLPEEYRNLDRSTCEKFILDNILSCVVKKTF